jgi:hypothetical protein
MKNWPPPDIDFLRDCSDEVLQEISLRRANHAAGLRKQILAMIEEMADQIAAVELANAIVSLRRRSMSEALGLQKRFQFQGDAGTDPALAGRGKAKSAVANSAQIAAD